MSALQRIDCLSRASYLFVVGSTEGCGNQQGLWTVRHAGRVVEKDLRWFSLMVLLLWKTVAAVKAWTVAKYLGVGHAGGSFGDVNLQRRRGTTLASGFALEYSVHALVVGLRLQ
jgi:hypothetical protein